MLECENYKMLKGIMKIMPINSEIKPYNVKGTWLYKPEYKCWYCNGWSYPERICSVIADFNE